MHQLHLAVHDALVKFTPAHTLHDEVYLGVGFDQLQQLDDVGMSQLSHYTHFSRNVHLVSAVLDHPFVQDFYCHFALGRHVPPFANAREGAFADSFAHAEAVYSPSLAFRLRLAIYHL